MAIDQKKFKDIIDYYDQTQFDYRVAWDNSENPAVHFGYYDEQASSHVDALQNTNKVLAELAQVKAGDAVLDAGCGKGGSCFWLVKNKQAIPTGITPVASQIEACQKQAKTLQLTDQTSFVLADFCQTPFEKESFDVVWACESLCHADQKADFYQEAFRVLKPGGRLVIAEYIRKARPLPAKDDQLLLAWLKTWAIKDIDTEAEHLQHAQRAGFQDILIKDVTANTKTSLRNLHNNSKNWRLFGKLMRLFRMRTQVQQDNQDGSILQYQALEKNLWFYSFIHAVKPK
ncbi:MAG: cyclopropane-fatty-acyl-phospholipid synthase family protein [Saprospiraceae bacterium]